MNAIQLDLPVEDKSEIDIKLEYMQKQVDAMNESMGKVRRKLFSQMGELQKLCLSLQNENNSLKTIIQEVKNEKTEWTYAQGDNLFDVRTA